MEKFLREWRQDALDKQQYDSAVFIGDKLLALTGDERDAFWLAQVHFSTGNYSRAQAFLTKHDLLSKAPSCRYLAAHASIKQNKFEEALQILGDKNPVHLITAPGSARRKLQHVDGRPNGHQKTGSRSDRADRSEERDKEDITHIRYEAAMCYLRGLCYAKQNAFDRAKECYKDAVRIDVQCFEAFDALMKNALLSPSEEWQFLESLNFDTVSTSGGDSSTRQEAASFAKMLYTTRLSKYEHPSEFATATETLATHYNLSQNADILLSKADLLFTQCRFTRCLELTSQILSSDKYNFAALPLHLSVLHELNHTNTLFLLAHDLADNHPNRAESWFAVGTYYLSTARIGDARRYFSKSSMMDPHFGPAWIGFAHTFAAEGEHDQAISAYSTAARLFQGTHLPQLYLGMQNLQLANWSLANEYLNTAYTLCKNDPLVLNELGVCFYHQDQYPEAITLFTHSLNLSTATGADGTSLIPTRTNLGHAYRRVGRYKEALEQFDEVLRLGGADKNGAKEGKAGTFCSRGLVLLEMGDAWQAVVALHEALAVSPQDPVATDLLSRALEATERIDVVNPEDEDAVERKLESARRDMAGRVRSGRRGKAGGADSSSMGGSALGGSALGGSVVGDGSIVVQEDSMASLESAPAAEEISYGGSMLVDSDGE